MKKITPFFILQLLYLVIITGCKSNNNSRRSQSEFEWNSIK